MITDARPRVGESDAPLPPWRRRLRAWSRLLGGLALIASPWWGRALLRQLDFFRVQRVEIEGVRYASPDEIVSLLRVDTSASIWDDASPLEARVEEHPQVRDASIRRRLPGTLVVHVIENPPVALVSGTAGLVVTDAVGDSLPVDPTAMDVDLPVLAARDTLLLRLLGAVQASDPGLFARLSEASRTDRGEVVLHLGEYRVLAEATVTTSRLAELLPVELDLARRGWRAVELDLRFRDQVIARLRTP